MITLIIGKRTDSFKKTLDKVISASGAQTERRELISGTFGTFFDEVNTPSLFGDKKIFVLSNVIENEDVKTSLVESIESLAQAPNDIVILGESILAADMKKFEPHATIHKITEKETKERAFDPFMLANAFSTGDKKKTWIAFMEVAANSDEMEPVHGMIWWKLKSMLGKSGAFTEGQMKTLARDLVSTYHESRKGGLAMRERLEHFFLTMPSLKK